MSSAILSYKSDIFSYLIFFIAALIKFLSTHFDNIGLVFKINRIYCYVSIYVVEKYLSNKNSLDKYILLFLFSILEIY
jgi:hypothetical protein